MTGHLSARLGYASSWIPRIVLPVNSISIGMVHGSAVRYPAAIN